MTTGKALSSVRLALAGWIACAICINFYWSTVKFVRAWYFGEAKEGRTTRKVDSVKKKKRCIVASFVAGSGSA